MSYPYLIRRNNHYYCRIWIPEDLKPHFTCCEIKRSLKTTNCNNARTLVKALVYNAERVFMLSHKVWRGQVEILVAAKEYDVLVYMVRNAGITLSRKNIAENCWEQPIETFSNIIDVYINYLRKKLDGKFPTKLIHTVRGQGFVLEER